MKLIVRRTLKDFEAWRALVTGADDTRRQYGSRGGTAYRAVRDPNEVYIVFDWDDDQPPSGYFELPEVQQALRDTGTTEIIEVSGSFDVDR
jgi:hypothetical protein